MTIIQDVKPDRIEPESFRIIESEFESQTGHRISSFNEDEFAVIRRVIHATGDFSFADSLKFSSDCIEAARKSLQGGRKIYCDVSMLQAGVSKVLAKKYGSEVICKIHHDDTIRLAKEKGVTRSDAALECSIDDDPGIILVGNAPTALLKALDMIAAGQISPDLIVGVPVGFVNAAESKELLIESGFCSITTKGRRGGTPVAAAIMNALFRLV